MSHYVIVTVGGGAEGKKFLKECSLTSTASGSFDFSDKDGRVLKRGVSLSPLPKSFAFHFGSFNWTIIVESLNSLGASGKWNDGKASAPDEDGTWTATASGTIDDKKGKGKSCEAK